MSAAYAIATRTVPDIAPVAILARKSSPMLFASPKTTKDAPEPAMHSSIIFLLPSLSLSAPQIEVKASWVTLYDVNKRP